MIDRRLAGLLILLAVIVAFIIGRANGQLEVERDALQDALGT